MTLCIGVESVRFFGRAAPKGDIADVQRSLNDTHADSIEANICIRLSICLAVIPLRFAASRQYAHYFMLYGRMLTLAIPCSSRPSRVHKRVPHVNMTTSCSHEEVASAPDKTVRDFH